MDEIQVQMGLVYWFCALVTRDTERTTSEELCCSPDGHDRRCGLTLEIVRRDTLSVFP